MNNNINTFVQNNNTNDAEKTSFRFNNDTLEGTVLNIFIELTDYIADTTELNQAAVILGSKIAGSGLLKNYKNIDVEKYKFLCANAAGAAFNAYTGASISEQILTGENIMRKELLLETFNESGIKIRDGDTWGKISKRYERKFSEKFASEIDFLEGLFEKYSAVQSRIDSAKKLFNLKKKDIEYAQKLIINLIKDIDMVKTVRERNDITLSDTEVEYALIDLLTGNMTTQRLLKTLAPKKNESFTPLSTNKINTTVTSNDVVYEQKIYDVSTSNYLSSKGMTLPRVKEILDRSDSQRIVNFVRSLDAIFTNYNIPEELNSLIRNIPDILTMPNGDKKLYVETLEKIYDVVSPMNISGILPSYNKISYSSLDGIIELADKMKTKSVEVKVENQDKFSKYSKINAISNFIELHPYAGKQIPKWAPNRFQKDKTAIYKKYSEEFGEGHFREFVSKDTTVIFKLNHDGQGKYVAKICDYFGEYKDNKN